MTARLARTPREKCGLAWLPRSPDGRVVAVDALARFRSYCRFDPLTGCVLWTGGTSSGRGNSAKYGVFWFEGRRWFAHRWAAIHVHGLAVDGLQVGHCCPHTTGGPNTLCVEHVEPTTQADNLDELHGRRAQRRFVEQSNEQRQFWLLVELGYEEAPPTHAPAENDDDIPFFIPPAWLGPQQEETGECPF